MAAVAAVVSHEHASALVRAHGESGWTARLIPLTVDGLIYASSMAMLGAAGRGVQVPALARWLLGLGIAATLAANVTHGLCNGPVGAAVGAWPAVALVGSYELLILIIFLNCSVCAAHKDRSGISGLSGAVPVDPACWEARSYCRAKAWLVPYELAVGELSPRPAHRDFLP